jgi:hypothetical protein
VRKPVTKKSFAAVCAAAVAVTGAVAVGSSASAAEQETVIGQITRYERGVLRPVGAVTGSLHQKMTAARNNLLQNNARRGSNVDARSVSLFTDPGSKVIVASTDANAVDGIDIGLVDGVVAGMGLRTHDSDAGSAVATAPVIGFAGGPSSVGFRQNKTDSHEVTRADDGDLSSNFLQSWFWKFSLDEARESTYIGAAERANSDFWIYARRGEADAQASGHKLVDLTIRARPWGGTSGNFKNMIDNAPAGTSTSCSDNGAIGVGFGQAGVTLPLTTCSSVSGVTSSNGFEFGADWDGRTQNQIGVEAVASYKVKEGYTPAFADYIWATFDPGLFGSNKEVKWSDTGW